MGQHNYLGSVDENQLAKLRCSLPGENAPPMSIQESVNTVCTAMFFTIELSAMLRGLTPNNFIDDEMSEVCQTVMQFLDAELNKYSKRIKAREN